jgi:hypothetical protein
VRDPWAPERVVNMKYNVNAKSEHDLRWLQESGDFRNRVELCLLVGFLKRDEAFLGGFT